MQVIKPQHTCACSLIACWIMDTVLVSLVKDKKGLLTDKNNYRPIAITSVASKMLEKVILRKVEHLLNTMCYQFGFKTKHSTDLCVFAMKEIINYYHSGSTPVYVCYIDATKAFDKVNHWHLLRKLLDRNVPKCFVRLLMAWLTTQAFTVRWAGVQTTSFKVTNGVRQGGILSPRLFAIYVDKLSEQLESSKVGCHINKQCMNHLFYADDAVLLAPTVDALQKLIDVCQDFARKGDMVYNFEKSECTAFIPNTLGHIHTPDAYLGDKKLNWVD